MKTKVVKIKGKILDEEGKTIPSAFVYLSDSKGNAIYEIAKTRANLDGEYSLPFSDGVINPNVAGDNTLISKYISFRTSGYPVTTVAFPESIINSSKSEEVFNYKLIPREIKKGEVIISAKSQCEQKGNKWDDVNKKCITPLTKNPSNSEKTENNKKNWWNKNKWFVIGGFLLIAAVTTIVVIKKK